MSSVHFAVECSSQRSRVIDQKSANGTHLNGAKIAEAVLSNGDQIRAGQTIFAVRMVADEKLPEEQRAIPVSPSLTSHRSTGSTRDSDMFVSASDPGLGARSQSAAGAPSQLRKDETGPPRLPTPLGSSWQRAGASGKVPFLQIGGWIFFALPVGWEVKDEFGIQRTGKDRFPSTVTATDETLQEGIELQAFVELQISMLRQYLREAKIEATLSPVIPGAEEKISFNVRYSTRDGQILFYRRVYARSGKTVGAITLTSLENDLEYVLPEFDVILAGVQFQGKK